MPLSKAADECSRKAALVTLSELRTAGLTEANALRQVGTTINTVLVALAFSMKAQGKDKLAFDLVSYGDSLFQGYKKTAKDLEEKSADEITQAIAAALDEAKELSKELLAKQKENK